MREIRIHGRGGQGIVNAGILLAEAFFQSGKWVQTFPMFGTERRGAPVASFVRIGDSQILQRYNVYKPHDVLVADPTVMEFVDVFAGLREEGRIFINSVANRPEVHESFKVHYIDATAIALKWKLGTEQAPIVNTALVGFYLRICNVALEHGLTAIDKHIPIKVKANKQAMISAYHSISRFKNG